MKASSHIFLEFHGSRTLPIYTLLNRTDLSKAGQRHDGSPFPFVLLSAPASACNVSKLLRNVFFRNTEGLGAREMQTE